MNANAEIKVTDSSEWATFEKIDREFSEAFSARSVAVCDSLDEAYYDHDVDGTIVTVHLQHYLGVRIFLRHPEKATAADLSVLRRISDYYEKKPNQPLQRNASRGSVSNLKPPARCGYPENVRRINK